MKFLFLLILFFLSCSPSSEKTDTPSPTDTTTPSKPTTPPPKEISSPIDTNPSPQEDNLEKDSQHSNVFTIVHDADDSEDVFISYELKTFQLNPGECIFLKDYEFSILGVQLGLGGESILNFWESKVVCGLGEALCEPNHYVIKDTGWFLDEYVMVPGPQHPLNQCTNIKEKI